MTGNGTDQTVEEVQNLADSLETGDQVRVNKRKRALTVTDRYKRPKDKVYYYDSQDHFEVIELEGNGTRYHLLWMQGDDWKPMLYKESNWEQREDGGYEYPRMGDRVLTIEVRD